jgi:hypothetical protein
MSDNVTSEVVNVLKEIWANETLSDEEEQKQQFQPEPEELHFDALVQDYPGFQKRFQEKFARYTGPIEYPDE